jgi:hypothetical protein
VYFADRTRKFTVAIEYFAGRVCGRQRNTNASHRHLQMTLQLHAHALAPRVTLSFTAEPEVRLAVTSDSEQNTRLLRAALIPLFQKFLSASAGKSLTVWGWSGGLLCV